MEIGELTSAHCRRFVSVGDTWGSLGEFVVDVRSVTLELNQTFAPNRIVCRVSAYSLLTNKWC